MPANTPLDTYFGALNETYDAFMDAVQLGVERGHRLSTTFLIEAQRGQHELIELGRTFATEPTNVGGIFRQLWDSADRGRTRTLELGRNVVDELAQSQKEARETFDRMAAQQRLAGNATVQIARETIIGISDRAQVRLRRTLEQGQPEQRSGAAAAVSDNRGAADGSSPRANTERTEPVASDRVASDGGPPTALLKSSNEAAPPSGESHVPAAKPRRSRQPDAERIEQNDAGTNAPG